MTYDSPTDISKHLFRTALCDLNWSKKFVKTTCLPVETSVNTNSTCGLPGLQIPLCRQAKNFDCELLLSQHGKHNRKWGYFFFFFFVVSGKSPHLANMGTAFAAVFTFCSVLFRFKYIQVFRPIFIDERQFIFCLVRNQYLFAKLIFFTLCNRPTNIGPLCALLYRWLSVYDENWFNYGNACISSTK